MSKTQRIEEHYEHERQRREEDAALSQAAEHARMDQGEPVPNRSFFSEYGDADISPPPGADSSDLISIVAAELSHHNLYGNITQAERERLQTLNAGLAMQVKAEFPAPSGASSKCVGRYRRELLGEDEAAKPTLTPDMAREIESAIGEEGVRSQMQSQSVNASAWKGITQIQSVAHTVTDGARDAAQGLVGRTKDLLFGGDD